MSFFYAVAAWVVIAAVLIASIVAAAHGTLWLLVVSMVLFTIAFAKWGCMTGN
jgi:hypothetical protein